jgi:ubiquinone/menaquinone biosynthesis C-methylase UbiE
MRELPFPDGTFDVVLSSAAIHNLYKAEDRARAIGEIARVLKSGGRALIDDIRHGSEYTAAFAKNSCPGAKRLNSLLASALLTAITFGSLRPVTLLVRKET